MKRPFAQFTESANEFSPWCFSRAKRALDLVSSSVLILASSPIFLFAAMLIRLTSWGPILFRQARLGKDGCEIKVLKFRTMTHRRISGAPGITRRGDQRITPLGRFLRSTKIDELPQLINVLRGDMSMVGPRPDMAKYLDRVSPQDREVLLLTPGITSPTTLMLRNEEELLASVPENELEDVYAKIILTQKIRMELEYARRASFLNDVQVLLRTATAIVFPTEKATLSVTTDQQ